jgi:glycine cleavage system H protein
MNFPEELLYAETHEWVKDDGGQVTMGLTEFAQGQLRDIVYVELPEVGSTFRKGDNLGVVESVKTAADVFSPVTGKVVETNLSLKDFPQYINEDPYGKGWILKMEIQGREELKGLLSSEAYQGSLPKES